MFSVILSTSLSYSSLLYLVVASRMVKCTCWEKASSLVLHTCYIFFVSVFCAVLPVLRSAWGAILNFIVNLCAFFLSDLSILTGRPPPRQI